MTRKHAAIAAFLAVLCLVSLGLAAEKKSKPGKLAGIWEGTAHGTSAGDVPITLQLEHYGQEVKGSISTSSGSAEIASGTYKKKILELHLPTPEATYVVTGKLKKNELSGEWTTDAGEKGTWEAKKQAKPKT